jgi:hypothetical protein
MNRPETEIHRRFSTNPPLCASGICNIPPIVPHLYLPPCAPFRRFTELQERNICLPQFWLVHFTSCEFHSRKISDLKVLSSETKVGRNWYQSTGLALVLGRWTLFFNFKGKPSCISHKTFCRHLSTIFW